MTEFTIRLEHQDIRRQRHRIRPRNELPRLERRILRQLLRKFHIHETAGPKDVSVSPFQGRLVDGQPNALGIGDVTAAT